MDQLNLEVGKTYLNRKGHFVTIVNSKDHSDAGKLFIGLNYEDSIQYPYFPDGLIDRVQKQFLLSLAEEATEEQMLSRSIKFSYTNYRGDYSVRTALIIKTDWGTTEWHPEPGYLLTALDFEKKQIRQFALKDCDFTETEA